MPPVLPRSARAFAALLCLASVAGCGGAAAGPDPKRAASLLAEGWDEYRTGEFKRAGERFEDAERSAPAGSDLRLQARYGLASALGLRGSDPDPEHAAALYEGIVAEAPRHDLAAWSLLALARLEHAVPAGREPDLPKARAAYARVIAAFPNHLAGEEAFIYLQGSYLATLEAADARKSLAALSGFIRTHARSRFISPAWALVAEAHQTLRQPRERLHAELKALAATELDPTNPLMDHANAYWRIAGLAEFEAKDPATARRFYAKLIAEYPTDSRRYGAQQALKRLGRPAGYPRQRVPGTPGGA